MGLFFMDGRDGLRLGEKKARGRTGSETATGRRSGQSALAARIMSTRVSMSGR